MRKYKDKSPKEKALNKYVNTLHSKIDDLDSSNLDLRDKINCLTLEKEREVNKNINTQKYKIMNFIKINHDYYINMSLVSRYKSLYRDNRNEILFYSTDGSFVTIEFPSLEECQIAMEKLKEYTNPRTI